MIIELEMHPRWPSEWMPEKRERATLALCTHLTNSRVHTLYGLETEILTAEPERVLGANPQVQFKDKILLTIQVDERGKE